MAERIDELADPRVADYAHVGDPAWLRDHGLFVAEGRLVVERLIHSGRFRIRSILLTPAALDALAHVLESGQAPVYLVRADAMERLTGFDFHRGCLALAERADTRGLPAWPAHGGRLLGLEGIANPDNVGGLFRVAAAFGADAVILDPTSGDPLYRKAVRTSMGSVLHMPCARLDQWPAALGAFRRDGFTIVALTPREPALRLDEYARSLQRGQHLILLVGAEGAGLSDPVLEFADARVRIPVAASVDSLNVVVAAGIALAALQPSS